MSVTMESMRGLTENTYEHPQDWLSGLWDLRNAGYEIVLLDGYEDTLSGFLLHPTENDTQAVHLTAGDSRSVSVPRPSRHGMGELIWAEEVVQQQLPWLTWEEPLYENRRVKGKGIFTYPLGPVRADVAESISYQLHVMGDEIVRLDLRHQFKRRHIRKLCQGKSVDRTMPWIERITTTSTVAHSLAFCLALEQANGVEVPLRESMARTILAELERAVSHLGDLAGLAVSTGLPVPQMEYLRHKEALLRINRAIWGHRYLRGIIRPGGVVWPAARDVPSLDEILGRLFEMSREVSKMAEDLAATPSFLDRLHGAGRIPTETRDFIRPVGPVGRSSNRSLDVRRWQPYAGYRECNVAIPRASTGDSYDRYAIKSQELDISLSLIRTLVERFWRNPEDSGEARRPFYPDSKAHPTLQGLALVEAPRGLMAYRVILDGDTGLIRHVGFATPSQRNWYVVPAAMANHNILQDFPIIDASFALSVAGWDA